MIDAVRLEQVLEPSLIELGLIKQQLQIVDAEDAQRASERAVGGRDDSPRQIRILQGVCVGKCMS